MGYDGRCKMIDPTPMDILILTGKTQKGKNRIHEWGERWTTFGQKTNRVHFTNPGIGPWIMIRSIRDGDGLSSRWLALGQDIDFDVSIAPK